MVSHRGRWSTGKTYIPSQVLKEKEKKAHI